MLSFWFLEAKKGTHSANKLQTGRGEERLLLLPLLKIAPSVYNWRIRSKIFRSYGDLKFLENELRQKYDPARHDEYLARLDRIEDEAYTRSIPLAFSDLFYTLREHINGVRTELFRLDAAIVSRKKT